MSEDKGYGMISVVYTPYSKFDEIVRDLEKKLKLDFEPEFFFLFLTESTWKDYKKILEYLKKKFPNCKMAGCIVEGYITDEIWMRGLAIVFFEHGVNVFWAKDKNTTKTFEILKNKIGTKYSSVITIFPMFYFSSRFDVLKLFANDRLYWFKYKRVKNLEDKLKILDSYSKKLESKYVFPVNKALRIFDGNFPVIGMNLMPLEAGYGTPLIIANYKNIGRGAVAVCFKGKTNAIFYDVFPERGKSFEETIEVIKNYFPNVELVDVIKKGVTIAEVNNVAPVEFLKRKLYKGIAGEEEVLSRLEKGKLSMVSPYGLAFISRNTLGCSCLGLLPYPLNIYSSLFDLDIFYDKAIFLGERIKGGIHSFGEIFENKLYSDTFDIFMIDSNTIMMFGKGVHKIKNFAQQNCKEFFGIFTLCPSFRLSNLIKAYFSEIEKGLCFNSSGTSTMLEIKNLRL